MKRFEHTIQTPAGIHGRPARQLAKIARQFSDTAITVIRDGKSVSADALMKLLLLDVRPGDTVTVICDGPNEMAAAVAMQNFFWNYL